MLVMLRDEASQMVCADFNDRPHKIANIIADEYTASQLIMISHDRLAQYWEDFGHISYYQRVDLDALMRNGLPQR